MKISQAIGTIFGLTVLALLSSHIQCKPRKLKPLKATSDALNMNFDFMEVESKLGLMQTDDLQTDDLQTLHADISPEERSFRKSLMFGAMYGSHSCSLKLADKLRTFADYGEESILGSKHPCKVGN